MNISAGYVNKTVNQIILLSIKCKTEYSANWLFDRILTAKNVLVIRPAGIDQ